MGPATWLNVPRLVLSGVGAHMDGLQEGPPGPPRASGKAWRWREGGGARGGGRVPRLTPPWAMRAWRLTGGRWGRGLLILGGAALPAPPLRSPAPRYGSIGNVGKTQDEYTGITET